MASVVLITLAALAGVAVLAVQANGSSAGSRGTTSSVAEHQVPPQSNPTGTATAVAVDPLALPAHSGTGPRIVYTLAGNRIWLVKADGSVQQTIQVVPGTVRPEPGSYKVTSRQFAAGGQDHTSVQYVVIFGHTADGKTSFGFDTIAGSTGMPDPPTQTTGGVRMKQEDALAVWQFTSGGTAVIVVA